MPYYDPQGREVRYSDAYAAGRLRPGFKHVVGDGEAVHVDVFAMDRATVFLTDAASGRSMADAKAEVAKARAAWLTDKAQSYRNHRTEPSAAPPARDTSVTDVKAARAAWLADKQTAYRGDR